jgi:hypothetical protein
MAHPIDDPELILLLEACRPGSNDMHAPEMVGLAAQMAARPEVDRLYERLQGVDRVLAGVIRDVPVQEGLSQRLLASLAVALNASSAAVAPPEATEPANASVLSTVVATPECAAVAPPESAALSERPALANRRLRRFWLAAAVSAVLAASVFAVVATPWLKPAVGMSRGALLQEAIALFHQENHAVGERVRMGVAVLDEYPYSACLPSQFHELRWRPLRGFLNQHGADGVAYDIVSVDGVKATLYVVENAFAGLNNLASSAPWPTTNGCTAAAWQEGRLLYVLVVSGEMQDYERFFQSARGGPVT